MTISALTVFERVCFDVDFLIVIKVESLLLFSLSPFLFKVKVKEEEEESVGLFECEDLWGFLKREDKLFEILFVLLLVSADVVSLLSSVPLAIVVA
jgi:hypothetical protein